jgi:hypothetical protein
MGGRTSSYAAAGIALEFIVVYKPLTEQQRDFDKVEIQLSGKTVFYFTKIISCNIMHCKKCYQT